MSSLFFTLIQGGPPFAGVPYGPYKNNTSVPAWPLLSPPFAFLRTAFPVYMFKHQQAQIPQRLFRGLIRHNNDIVSSHTVGHDIVDQAIEALSRGKSQRTTQFHGGSSPSRIISDGLHRQDIGIDISAILSHRAHNLSFQRVRNRACLRFKIPSRGISQIELAFLSFSSFSQYTVRSVCFVAVPAFITT